MAQSLARLTRRGRESQRRLQPPDTPERPPPKAHVVSGNDEEAMLFGLPHDLTYGDVRRKRQELRGTGLRGTELHQAMKGWRQKVGAAGKEWAEQQIESLGPISESVQRPQQFLRNVMKGKGPATRRMMYLRQAQQLLSMRDTQQRQEDFIKDLMEREKAGTLVDRHLEQRPTWDRTGEMMRSWIDPATGQVTGFDAPYLARLQRGGLETLAGGRQNQERATMSRAVAQGIDPRSAMMGDQAYRISAGQAQGGLDLQDRIAQINEAERRRRESMLEGRAVAEESSRGNMVGQDLAARGQLIGGLGQAAGQEETAGEFDVTYTEGQRQAAQQRADAKLAMKKAREAAEVEWWEQVGSAIEGMESKLGMGGGGGGGMGAIMGGG